MTKKEAQAILMLSEKLKDKIAFYLLFSTGMNFEDMAGLKTSDIDFKTQTIKCANKRFYIQNVILDSLKQYIYNDVRGEFVFEGLKGKAISIRSLKYRLMLIAQKANPQITMTELKSYFYEQMNAYDVKPNMIVLISGGKKTKLIYKKLKFDVFTIHNPINEIL